MYKNKEKRNENSRKNERGGASLLGRNSNMLDTFSGKNYNLYMKNYSSKEGFTLAEVLITLGIIGIVAALTIPTLVAKFQEKALVSQFKKNIFNVKSGLAIGKL